MSKRKLSEQLSIHKVEKTISSDEFKYLFSNNHE